jgi:hypothetical protein
MTIIRWMRRTTTGRCRILVKLRRTQREQMSSQLPLKAEIAQYGRHFAFVPDSDMRRSGNVQYSISSARPKAGTITPKDNAGSIRQAQLSEIFCHAVESDV